MIVVIITLKIKEYFYQLVVKTNLAVNKVGYNNKWYQMFENDKIIINMQSNFESWIEQNQGDTSSEGIDEVLVNIAEHYGFEFVAKYTLISVFRNQHDEILMVWHNIHYKDSIITEEGFISPHADLIDLYWKENKISNSEYRDLFYKFNKFSEIPEKLQQAVVEFIEDPQRLSVKSYQNIYHNLYKKKSKDFEKIANRYKQKAQVVKFLNAYGFTKPKQID